MIPFNYHHLYYFYAVARHGSVSKAAREVRVSQPALSAQIKQFEGSLGHKLFERDGRNLRLTEDGKTAYSYAREIFDTGREFVDSLRDRASKGRIRIQVGATNSIPKSFTAALLDFILKQDSSAHILLHENTIEAMVDGLQSHALDLVLSDVPHRTSAEEEIQNRLVGRVPILFCATRAIASKAGRLPDGLNGAPLILPTSHSGIYHAVLEYLAARKVTPNIVAEVQDVELIHRLALEGAGIAPLSRFSVLASPWKKQLVILPSDDRQDIHDTIYLITRKRKKNHPLVDAVLARFKIPS